jgi:hypothetical protein
VGAAFLKGCSKELEALERVTLVFHGKYNQKFGKVVYKRNEIGVAFA